MTLKKDFVGLSKNPSTFQKSFESSFHIRARYKEVYCDFYFLPVASCFSIEVILKMSLEKLEQYHQYHKYVGLSAISSGLVILPGS